MFSATTFIRITKNFYPFMLMITPKFFNIPILFSCLNITSLLLPNLQQIMEITNASLKMYDILEFFYFSLLIAFNTKDCFYLYFNKLIFTLFLPVIIQYVFFSFEYLIIGNIQVLFHHCFKILWRK